MPPNDEHHSSGTLNGLFLGIATGAMALVVTLILASYAYTWAQSSRDAEEKSQWRKEHQQVLDRKFEEVKQTQERLAQKIEESKDSTRELLQQVLEEQRRYNYRIEEQKRPPFQRGH